MVGSKQKPTIYDIARLSGASASTVSAALNGTWQERRIGAKTAARIQEIARQQGYSTNLQARGLRKARSGLIGMILPVHDNRFFSSISQSFEADTRERGYYPVISSTLRDPKEEIRTVETLISYAVDALFITGATDPEALSEICIAANVPHIHIDLPGTRAPSVVSDNYLGATLLSRKIVQTMSRHDNSARGKVYFVGGDIEDYASARRVQAFRDMLRQEVGDVSSNQIIPCGYSPGRASREISALYDRLGGLPAGLFVNSLTAFEGALNFFVTLPNDAFDQTVIGCYDYDPFGAFLQFPVHMVRQNSEKLIAKAYELFDSGVRDHVLVMVEPDLIAPRTIYKGRFAELG
jgi:LacI family transcriptional regulator, fructose operon transcriptional repressor